MILTAIWGAGSGWFLPGFFVSIRAGARKKDIQLALPDALDLLVICVEAGLGLNQALIRVAKEIRHVSALLAEELSVTNFQIRAGIPRAEALKNLGERTGVPDVRTLVTTMIQTERFGTSIAHSLRVHADTLRLKRKQRAEEAAAKTTIKMIFPLALCVFPALFVVVLGPALIQIYQTLSSLS
jgi:tight adherence protein C